MLGASDLILLKSIELHIMMVSEEILLVAEYRVIISGGSKLTNHMEWVKKEMLLASS